MSRRLIKASQATAAKRRVYFDLRSASDGITPATDEAGGQPQISVDGAAFTNTGIGTLTAIGNGRYYAELTQLILATSGQVIETRYKSDNTAESPGDSVQVVGFDPDADIATIKALLEADLYVDSAQTPWQLVYIQKGTGNLATGTRLLVQNLKDVSGGDLVSSSTVVGQQVGV